MKQNDILLVVVSVIVGGTLSLLLTNFFFGESKRQKEAEVVSPITSEFVQPDSKYFNDSSYNPTQIIRIGGEDGEVKFGE